VIIRVPPAKNVLHEGARAAIAEIDRLGGQWHGDAVNLLGLPALLDAVVDKSHESSRHYYTDGELIVSLIFGTCLCREEGKILTRQHP